MRIYEEYQTTTEKRKAQVGAKRGWATGKARGYLIVFDEDGCQNGKYQALGECMNVEPGGPPSGSLTSCEVGQDYLRTYCRHVGPSTLPWAWKVAFGSQLDRMLQVHKDSDAELKRYKRKYHRVIRYSEVVA